MHPSKKEKPHDPVPNLQRQQQQQDRTRHPVRHLRGPPDADAKQMEQEAMTPTQRAVLEQVLESLLELVPDPQIDFGPAYEGTKQRRKKSIAALRALLAEQPAEPVEMSPEFTDTARAALLWVLWHHQGGSSPVGQPIRFALGMGAHDCLTDLHVAEAKRWAAQAGSTTADFHAPQPAKRVQLTREELADAWLSVEHITHATERQIAFARAVIAAYEAKNGITGETK